MRAPIAQALWETSTPTPFLTNFDRKGPRSRAFRRELDNGVNYGRNPSATVEFNDAVELQLGNFVTATSNGLGSCNMDSILRRRTVVLSAVLESGFSVRERLLFFRPPGFCVRELAPSRHAMFWHCLYESYHKLKFWCFWLTLGAFRSSPIAFQQRFSVVFHDCVCDAPIVQAFYFRCTVFALDCLFEILLPFSMANLYFIEAYWLLFADENLYAFTCFP